MDPKIPVGILGATGSVGQKFIELLANHPWFEVTAVAASERSSGKPYAEAANWFLNTPIPPQISAMKVSACEPGLPCKIVFSGLDASVAGDIEMAFAKAGYLVISNSKNHRMDSNVPLLVPEINADHVELVKLQNYKGGKIITNPNCSVVGLVMSLKPLVDHFGMEQVNVVTMQALSGAGYPGISSLDIIDNVIPYIGGEEDKLETEPLKILGRFTGKVIEPLNLVISASCNRVPVIDGHLESVSVKLSKHASKKAIIETWRSFKGEPQALALPFAPIPPVHYFEEDNYPQPKLHRNLGNGMAVSIGRLRPCAVLDYKFSVLSHNTVRGAAGIAILNAELLVSKGYLTN